MPKYIRTKDEILKALDTDYMCGVKVYHTEKGMITEKLVVKTADTIEELCDGFYADDGSIETYNKNEFNRFQDYILDTGFDGYGFIKTDKGLIYVAKMDSEGKLVLI